MALRVHVSSVSIVFMLLCSVTTQHHLAMIIHPMPARFQHPMHALAGSPLTYSALLERCFCSFPKKDLLQPILTQLFQISHFHL